MYIADRKAENSLQEKDIVVSIDDLVRLAECAIRMPEYVTPADQLLIVRLQCSDGTQVNLRLDRDSL